MPSMKGFYALKHLPEEKITDKITRRVLVGDKEMVVWWSMTAWFPEDSEVVDVFSPPREDFLTNEAPAYMRKG